MKNKTYLILLSLCIMLIAIVVFRPHTEQASISISDKPDVTAIKTNDSVGWIEMVLLQNHDEQVQMAKTRGEMMRELIRSNPEQAIREALSLSEWSRLSPEIQAHVEQPFSTIANVEVMIACGEGISETIISTIFPTTGKMETFVYGRRNGLGTKNGAPVQGIRVGDVGVLSEEIFQLLADPDEEVALKIFPVAIADPGGDSVAALGGGKIFYFKSRAALDEANARLAALEELPGPSAGAEALFESLEAYLSADGEIDFAVLEEMAIEAMTAWTGTPRDMYVIMCDFSDITGQPADPVTFSNALNAAISEQIWEMSYEKTHIVGTVNPTTYRMPSPSSTYTNNSGLLHTDAKALAVADGVDLSPYETVCVLFQDVPAIGWAGLASVGGVNMWLNGTINNDVVIHELGHNYGARHASTWTNAVSSNPVEPAPTGGKIEYGDFTDIMGGGDSPEGHFNAWHKKKIAWFDADNWQTVTNSGTYRIYRSDHYQTTGLLRGIEIAKGSLDNYWVGLRQEYPAYDSFSRGAYLIWKQWGDNRSYLLDTSPLSAGGKQDGGLALGQTYSDSVDGVHITPTARGGQTPNEWMDITVNLGAFPGNSAPTASMSGATNLGVNTSTIFTVSASDADGDELAYYWDTGDGLVKPNGPSIPVAFVSGGTATVSCVVSDMKGGTNKVSQSVVVSSSLDNWMQRTSGTAKDLNDVALGGGRLVAVGGNNGTTAYSDDGTNWTVHTSGNNWLGNVFLYGVIYDGSQFIAVGMDYDGGWEHVAYTSTDGTYWTERYDSNSASAGNTRLHDVAYGGGVYVAVGDNGTIIRSTDGISWSNIVSGTTVNLTGVSYGNGKFVAVGDISGANPHVVLTSSHGTNWTDYGSGMTLDFSSYRPYDVQFCNDRHLAGGHGTRIQSSTDSGQTFVSTAGDYYRIPAFAYGNGTYFAAGHNQSAGNADINLISLDGSTWSELTTVSQDTRNAAIYFNGTFITVGENGSIWQSDPVVATGGGFAMWQLENKMALGLDRDPLDDADFDGSLNLEEYARGTTATDVGSKPSGVVYEDDGTYFQVSYGRNGIKSDVDYDVQRSVNLVSNDWSTANTVTLEDSVTNLAVRSAFTISSQTNEFMRLNLQLKNP